MKANQAVRVLAAALGAVGISFALVAAAATSADRTADGPPTALDPPRTAAPADQVRANTESGYAEDRSLAERVQAALDDDPELKQAMLRVQADQGQVLLLGSVSTFEQHDRALDIASAVQGVSGVEDGITLRNRPLPAASR